MILCDSHIDLNPGRFNPSITLLDCTKRTDYKFPDPNSYYILSDAGKNFKIMENSTVLLSFQKGYYDNYFSISEHTNLLLSFSNQLFTNSRPIDGIAKEALDLAILRSGKTHPKLENRL